MKTYNIATSPGDGIGKEVVPAGQQVLAALAASSKRFAFTFENFGWGGDYYRQHGMMMPSSRAAALRLPALASAEMNARSAAWIPVFICGACLCIGSVLWPAIVNFRYTLVSLVRRL